MKRQLSFWPTPEEPTAVQDIWGTLDPHHKEQVIAHLAKLIKTIAFREPAKRPQEVKNER
jgi:hypothetical protein